jgi:hypothetical protein
LLGEVIQELLVRAAISLIARAGLDGENGVIGYLNTGKTPPLCALSAADFRWLFGG